MRVVNLVGKTKLRAKVGLVRVDVPSTHVVIGDYKAVKCKPLGIAPLTSGDCLRGFVCVGVDVIGAVIIRVFDGCVLAVLNGTLSICADKDAVN